MTTTMRRAVLDELPAVDGRGVDGPGLDVLVVGAGITGSAVAYEAASRGLSVAVLDKGDVGAATSAATGKLIHGGLRYLKKLEVGLVYESLAERRIMADIAPPYVYPCPTVLPNTGIVERLGLTAYDVLATSWRKPWDPDKTLPRHRHIRGAEAARRSVPEVSEALLYHDAIMPDPERLTLAFLRSAVAHGAHVATYAQVSELLVEGAAVVGARVHDLLTGSEHTVRARVVVNAAGPWVHDLLSASAATAGIAGPEPQVRSEGIYLLTRQLTPQMTLFYGKHGHFSFAPWRGHSMIGPTETPYHGAVDDWRLTQRSITDFLDVINRIAHLPQPLTLADVQYAWGGLRPLTETAGADTYGASRASETVDHAHDGLEGLVTVAGGKYTTSRAFAQHTVDLLSRKLRTPVRASASARTYLDACAIPRLEPHVRAMVTQHPDVDPRTVEHLVRHYGTDAPALLALAATDPALADPLDDDGEVLAQVLWAVRHEMAPHLVDVFLRRTGLGTLGRPSDDVLARAAALVAPELGWDDARVDDEVAAVVAATELPVDVRAPAAG